MASNIDIELALSDLDAGKFSFRVVEAIKDHVSRIESELQTVSDSHARAMNDLRQQEYAIGRLEADLRKANGRVYALMKANALTEIFVREAKAAAIKSGEYLKLGAKLSAAALEKAPAYLASLDLPGKFRTVKAHPATEQALRETRLVLLKAQENLPVARKHAAATVEKASAYIAALHKKAA